MQKDGSHYAWDWPPKSWEDSYSIAAHMIANFSIRSSCSEHESKKYFLNCWNTAHGVPTLTPGNRKSGPIM